MQTSMYTFLDFSSPAFSKDCKTIVTLFKLRSLFLTMFKTVRNEKIPQHHSNILTFVRSAIISLQKPPKNFSYISLLNLKIGQH